MKTFDQRPLGVGLATALAAVIGLAGVLVGPYLIALGLWLADREVGDAAPLVLATESIVGLGAIGVGIVAFIAARGLWRGRAWAWPVAMFLGLALLAGMALIALLEQWLPPYLLVGAVAVLLVGALLPAPVRRTYGL